MNKPSGRVSAYITGLSLVIALTIAISLPSLYWVLKHQQLEAEVEVESAINAREIVELVAADRENWQQEATLKEKIKEDQTSTDLPEYRAVMDLEGKVLAETEPLETRWTVEHRTAIADDGKEYGSITVARDLRPVLLHTGIVALLALLLGLSVFVVLRIVPLRALNRALQDLQDLNDELEERVTERTRALSAAQQEAEAASRAKSAFLANMSHEIRTPMNSVLGMAHLLTRTPLTPVQHDYAEKIMLSGQHLLRLIDQILDLSKIEAGKLTLEVAPFDIRLVAANLCSVMEERAGAKKLDFACHLPPTLDCMLLGDSLRLAQILINLCGNAIKFTDAGRVELQVSIDEESESDIVLRFEVRDTGIGLSAGDRERIFRSFEQADVSTTRKFGGTGLGLAISRQLAELMDGRLDVSSKPGEGSTFWFTARFAKGERLSNDVAVATAGKASLDAEVSKYRELLQGRNILLAEDHPLNQMVGRALLEDVGCVVTIASNGKEALDLLHDNKARFDCVLMDVQMPVMDGYEATRQIRADASLDEVFVVAMTANATREDHMSCIDAGMDDFLTKPVDPVKLYTMLAAMLADAPPAQSSLGKGQDGALPAAPKPIDPELLPNFDRPTLEKLSGHNREKQVYFADIFKTSTQSDLEKIEIALDARDFDEASLIAHRIKGSARTIGALRLGELSFVMERMRRSNDIEKARETLERMKATFQETCAELCKN
ncbi:MAG TPA: response regulator [Aromatoleum sp.]|uniref:response regulator n=1 Tax=Aromatoleum sp. TaxID=2307007 RepID=UPI002B49D59A|nr:response regulator [Aromatoleum sp.]HJV25635.1 response regulator [Aromatoleum sp.]